MPIWKINGPAKISGEIKIHGNKNSALPCICASLLLPPESQIILKNVPQIKDVSTLLEVIRNFGINAEWTDGSTLVLSSALNNNLEPEKIEQLSGLLSKIRASILLLAPLIGKYNIKSLVKPGGDKIGSRPLFTHLTAFADLGFHLKEEGDKIFITPPPITKNPKQEDFDNQSYKIWLTEQSVTGTELMLLFSPFLGKNKSLTIYGAACEPHIVTLLNLLENMGASIEGKNSNRITVKWMADPQPPREPFYLEDDFMEATTYAVAAAMTKNDLIIKLNSPQHLELINRYLRWMGVSTELDLDKGVWNIKGSESSLEIDPRLTTIKAEPWPRFPTDVMSIFVVLATQCKGKIKFIEYMYDDRFSFVQTLKDMGAKIEENPPHMITVHGPTPLNGLEAFVRPDIRSGAALLIASLAASGTTCLYDKKDVIARGYENLPGFFKKLGASISETPENELI